MSIAVVQWARSERDAHGRLRFARTTTATAITWVSGENHGAMGLNAVVLGERVA